MTETVGARLLGSGRGLFSVWAPFARSVELRLVQPFEKLIPMAPSEGGLFRATADNVAPGTRYFYRLDGKIDRPDPASRHQPEGVRGPSEVVDEAFAWTDPYWCGLPLQDLVFYELHVGTFTPEGTLDAAAGRLERLRELGVTAVELMPVAQFPGKRNWGYDGVFAWAVQDSYGGPAALKRFVDRCHHLGLAVVLDVVHNHLGPEGCVLGDFGPYFHARARTPWGPGLNFDGPDSDRVRAFFMDSALRWVSEFRVDALRLDAVNEIADLSPVHFLDELGAAVHGFGRSVNRLVYLVAEDNRNDPRLVRPRELGGRDLDSQWSDDFHHALHALLTGERNGRFQDFGAVEPLAKAWREGFCFTGQYSRYRRRRQGAPADLLPARRFVVCAQNHDQVGNRADGARFGELLSFEAQKLAAGAVLLSPFLPLLFMGEEHGETAPFHFFAEHSDPALMAAVRDGRRSFLAAQGWEAALPDPFAAETFERSRPDWGLAGSGRHRELLALYQELLRLRRQHPALRKPGAEPVRAVALEEQRTLFALRRSDEGAAFAVFHFGDMRATVPVPAPPGNWRRVLDSADARWGGGGARTPEDLGSAGQAPLELAPKSFVLYEASPA
ncbi:MAG TPA: malto-oligosyltrehalose trehalohydrolase [Elusimicrobia bacterium]|nr:malto-oligosyltrehalose trehalohydrolase [Elusimicrobiota bacterium]